MAQFARNRPVGLPGKWAQVRFLGGPRLSATVCGMASAVGIDLGAVNSVVAVLQEGSPVVIPNAEGSRTTPSVVAVDRNGGLLVGAAAQRQAITNPDRTIRSVKRHMGSAWSTEIDGKTYNSQEISARTLMKLKRDAEAYLGETVTQAVIAVPAYFDVAQRTATMEACEIAGLEVLRFISETSATSVAFGFKNNFVADRTIQVFDLGGLHFSTSVAEIGDGVFEVKSVSGDMKLGGDHWDQVIVDWMVTQFKNAHGVDLANDRRAAQGVKEAAERAKIELSQIQSTTINIPFVHTIAEGPLHLELDLSRGKFQEITAHLLERVRKPFEAVISDAGLSKSDIDHVVVVGGSTRMPAVVELVESMTGKKANKSVNRDEAVAVGAAILAGVMKGDVFDVLLLDVVPQSLGIETKGQAMHKLIERNTTIPTRHTETVTMDDNNQRSVEIHVLQSERDMAMHSKTLGKFQLTDLPPAAGGVRQIDVTFDVDANETVYVSAIDQATGKEQSKTITGQSALSIEDIERMKTEAKLQADAWAAAQVPADAGLTPDGVDTVVAPPSTLDSETDDRQQQTIRAGTETRADEPGPGQRSEAFPRTDRGVDLGIVGLEAYQEIGTGGFATVYSALDVAFDRTVAVKVLTAVDDVAMRRFERERLSMGRIDAHPNVVTPYGSGYTNPDGRPYIAMEYLARGSLETQLRSGPLSILTAIRYVVEVAGALGYAHNSGVLHNDIKPANILVSSTDVAKLGDFGISAIKEATATVAIGMTMAHTPPETFAADGSDARDERSDLYSLASTLFTLIAGCSPFEVAGGNNSPPAQMMRIISSPVPTVGHSQLDQYLTRAMAKDPADRFQTAATFTTALEELHQRMAT